MKFSIAAVTTVFAALASAAPAPGKAQKQTNGWFSLLIEQDHGIDQEYVLQSSF